MKSATLTLQTECVNDVLVEITPILLDHYEEIAWRKDKIKFNPDFGRYRELQNAGALRIYTAREDGMIVGYSVFILSDNLHYQIRQAANDIFYVVKDRRGVQIAQKLKDYWEAALEKDGVQVISLHIKSVLDWRALSDRWGYERTEHIVQKWIGE